MIKRPCLDLGRNRNRCKRSIRAQNTFQTTESPSARRPSISLPWQTPSRPDTKAKRPFFKNANRRKLYVVRANLNDLIRALDIRCRAECPECGGQCLHFPLALLSPTPSYQYSSDTKESVLLTGPNPPVHLPPLLTDIRRFGRR